MGRPLITESSLWEHVSRLQERHPPIRLAAVDDTVRRPAALRARYAGVFDYLARVELEVDRNVLELLTIMPAVAEIDRFFYQDVWQPQEIAHGILLDTLKQRLDLPPAAPRMDIQFSMRVLGLLAHLPAVQEVARFLYYLTGAATEREAVVAYSALIRGLRELGEDAVAETIVGPIKRQEPGHYAFYQMSATRMIQERVLAGWQLHLARLLRSFSFDLVGTLGRPGRRRQMGELMTRLDLAAADDLARFAAEISRLEVQLLWAERQGMRYPPYVLRAMRTCVAAYEEQCRPVR